MANFENRKGSYGRDDREDLDTSAFDKGHIDWIQKEFTKDTIDFAEKFGAYLVKNRLTTSQIRNIYGEVKRIEAKVKDDSFGNVFKDFLLLKPKLAYASKRAGTRGIEDFKKVMDKAHLAVVDAPDGKQRVEAFRNFTDFFEAVLAYHKASGGRE